MWQPCSTRAHSTVSTTPTNWLVQWSCYCSHMCIPTYCPWLPGYIDVTQNHSCYINNSWTFSGQTSYTHVTWKKLWEKYLSLIFIVALFTEVKNWKHPKCVSTEGWMNKQNVAYTYNVIWLGLKKKEHSDTCCNMEAPRGLHAKLNTPTTKGQTLYDSTYMRYSVYSDSLRQKVEWWFLEAGGGEWSV